VTGVPPSQALGARRGNCDPTATQAREPVTTGPVNVLPWLPLSAPPRQSPLLPALAHTDHRSALVPNGEAKGGAPGGGGGGSDLI
jgi:hypothetical protein